jgi:hypothetical protein
MQMASGEESRGEHPGRMVIVVRQADVACRSSI